MEGKEVPAKYVPQKEDPHLDEGRITNKDYAQSILELVKKMPSTQGTVSVTEEKELPPLPFNLVELSVYCEKHWGYSPQQTLDITQSLRDRYNAISYNQSPDSLYTSVSRKGYVQKTGCRRSGPQSGFSEKRVEVTLHRIDQTKTVSMDSTSFQEMCVDAIHNEDFDPTSSAVLGDINNRLFYTTLSRYMEKILSPLEEAVLCLRFGLENGKKASLAKIGAELGYSKQRISQIEHKACEKLKFSLLLLCFECFDWAK